MYGKYGGGDWGAPGAAGNEIPGFAFGRATHAVIPGREASPGRQR